jgi:peptide deformylase
LDQLASQGVIIRVRTFPRDEKTLRDPAARVAEITPEVVRFALELCAWMRREDGIGLAATQVEATGWDKAPALFAMARGPEDIVFINPVIATTGGIEFGEEGCLSFGRVSCELPAPNSVRISFLDLHGKPQTETFRGLAARCVAHETDHLKGRLMIDRMLRRDRKRFLEKLARSSDASRT